MQGLNACVLHRCKVAQEAMPVRFSSAAAAFSCVGRKTLELCPNSPSSLILMVSICFRKICACEGCVAFPFLHAHYQRQSSSRNKLCMFQFSNGTEEFRTELACNPAVHAANFAWMSKQCTCWHDEILPNTRGWDLFGCESRISTIAFILSSKDHLDEDTKKATWACT